MVVEQPPAVVASGVSKSYGSIAALADIDLSVRSGEVFCLLGPNGSGKTTFIRLLAGYLLPSAGSLRLAGIDVVADPIAARRRIGYVPESVPAYRDMRVREFVSFMARLRGIDAARLSTAVERVVELLNLQAVTEKPIRALSRGYRQRVGLAQALVHEPDVVVLDEPTNGLDPRQIIEVRNLIRSLAGRHTVLMSSHILGEVGRIADRVGVLLDGRLRGTRTVGDGADLEDWFLSLT
jgi:ABC-2 type transport system ATP-binding protein